MKRLLLIVCLFFAVSIYATPYGLVDTKKLSVKVLSVAPTVLPAAGKEFIYPKADGFWYTLNSAGTETRLSPFLTSVFGRTGAVVAQAGDYTAADVGLGNVDNTSDLNKAISTATQAALDAKQAALGFTPVPDTRTINTYPLSGDITLTKSDVGLGNVDNTSDVNKPVSTATQTALDLKLDASGLAADLNISAMTTEASPATDMYLVVDDAGTRKKVNWSSLPGSAGGEVNTASNTGTAGVGVFKQKNALDLELYKLLGSGGINVILNGTDYIDVKLDITGLTEETSPASGDYFVMYDATAGVYKKINSDNMPGSGGSSTFTGNTDTPSSYSGQAGKYLKVNAGASALEFTDAPSGGGGTPILSSISGESFIYPKTGIISPFSNAANSANITFNVNAYADTVALLSTSSNEPMQLPKFKIPTGTTSLKFRFVYEGGSAPWDDLYTVIWKMQYKKTTNAYEWSSVTSKNISTDTPAASSITRTSDTVLGSAVVTNMSSTKGLYVGQPVSYPFSLVANILTIDSDTQITVDETATATETSYALAFEATNPQVSETTITLVTLGLAVGDVVQPVIYVDSTSTYTGDVAFQLCEIEVVQ